MQVEDVASNPIDGASVSIEDTDSTQVAAGATGADGLVSNLEIVEEIHTVSGIGTPSVNTRNNHTVIVTAAGYQNYSDTETVASNTTHVAQLTAS